MKHIHAQKVLTSDGWRTDMTITIGADGRIEALSNGKVNGAEPHGILLPAPTNSHSHAFQRAMAGLTESRGDDPTDSFWTWRRLMYRFLDRLTPDDVESIVAFVQMEMLEAGFGASVEFHYLHHQPGGAPYENLSEMSERIAAGAATSGIGLTLLPVMYTHGGCDRRALGPGQIRFGNDVDRFATLYEGAAQSILPLTDDCCMGVSAHSLRAVPPEGLRAAIALAGHAPFHMHLAEQVAEVTEVQAAWGKRPVEWLLDNATPAANWCLIHCTQMQPHETIGLAQSGAVAGLCPITESNLGDGIFDGVRWMESGGAISIGSDSDILMSLHEELRVLDNSQRLRDKSRAALATAEHSTGRRIFEAAAKGGAQAAGRGKGVIAIGEWADLLSLDAGHVDLAGLPGDTALDAFIFAGRDVMIRDVWSAGRHLVQAGRHVAHDAIAKRYAKTVLQLREAL